MTTISAPPLYLCASCGSPEVATKSPFDEPLCTRCFLWAMPIVAVLLHKVLKFR